MILVMIFLICCSSFFFFNDTATTEIYTLSLHDALPIWTIFSPWTSCSSSLGEGDSRSVRAASAARTLRRSEEHTSELQSPCNLVCRLLLEKKKNISVCVTPSKKNRLAPTC